MANSNPAAHPPFHFGHGHDLGFRTHFPFISGSSYIRPNIHGKDYNSRDEKYHSDYAKWALYNSSEAKHSDWIRRIKRNKRFYAGNQWEGPEDIESFLLDETGQVRNRIKVVINRIRPLVEQYRGNAIRLGIGAQAESVSNGVKNRREESLRKALLTTEIAQEFKHLGAIIKEYDSLIQNTPVETERMHENLWVDTYVRDINRMIQYVAELNELQEQQITVAENLIWAGIGLIDNFEHGGHLRQEAFSAEEFFWDRNARRPDLQDAAYMGRAYLMNLPMVEERWQGISTAERQALHTYTSNSGVTANTWSPDQGRTNIGNSVPVYKTFWRDSESKWYGWVMDDFDQPYFTEIDAADEFANGKIWTDADLIEPPDTPFNRRNFKKGQQKRKSVVDVLRYCILTPGEAIGYTKDISGGRKEAVDIVYEYGMYDWQETNWYDLSNVKYPIKASTWSYIDGEVLSPLDDAIDPQRLTNRIMSAMEGQINNSGGAGVFYDKDSIDEGEEYDLNRAMKLGQGFGLRTKGKGVPNTVIPYDNTIKAGTYGMFGLIQSMNQVIQETTGVNEGLKGESTGSDQLVGVTQLLIQQGSLIQEPFYRALARVFHQTHQYTANIGKRIYINNQRELDIMAGDEGVQVFKLSEGMRNEDFRVFTTKSNSPEQDRQAADAALGALLGAQQISKPFFVKHWGRSTLQEIQSDFRIQTKREQLAALREMAQQNEMLAAASAAEESRQADAIEAAQRAENDALLMQESQAEQAHQRDLEKIGAEAIAKNATVSA